MKVLVERMQVSDRRLRLIADQQVSPGSKPDTDPTTGDIEYTQFQGVLTPGREPYFRPELHFSPFPVLSWTDTWKFEIEVRDKKGVFAKLTNLLGSDDVRANILSHEVVPLSNNISKMSLICDMTRYGESKNPDRCSKDREVDPSASLQFLCDVLTVEFLDNVEVEVENGIPKPHVFATRLDELRNVGRLYQDRKHDKDRYRFDCRVEHRSDKTRAEESDNTAKTVAEGILDIPEHIWNRFIEFSNPASDGTYSVSSYSETEQHYVKFMALPNSLKDFFTVEIVHTDRVGQIARFTDVISRSLNLNIVASYMVLKETDGFEVWRCLVECDRDSADGRKEEIRVAFHDEWYEIIRDRRLHVSFPVET